MKKNVIVTGASRGLGKSIAEEFAKHGYNIIINYLNSEKDANDLACELQKKYKIETLTVKADISKEEDVKRLLEKTKEKFKTIDILINNAGIAIDCTLEDKTIDNFKKIIDTNLIGTFLTNKYIGLEMKKQRYGSIVNISSTNGIDSYYPYSMDYDASKAGVISLTHNFAVEYAPNVRVNSVAPGWINTDMNKELDCDYIKEECTHILLNRFADPKEIAECVFFTATNTYINDSIIKIDGGRY